MQCTTCKVTNHLDTVNSVLFLLGRDLIPTFSSSYNYITCLICTNRPSYLGYLVTECANYLGSESTEKGKDELREGEGKVLVEEVTQEDSHSMVGPATVDQ